MENVGDQGKSSSFIWHQLSSKQKAPNFRLSYCATFLYDNTCSNEKKKYTFQFRFLEISILKAHLTLEIVRSNILKKTRN